MKKSAFFIFMIFIFSAFPSIIDGHAYLEGESDHSGIEVILQRTAPDTNFRDTLITGQDGYYSFTADQGWYETYYGKGYWFSEDTLTAINGYSDITLTDITLIARTSLSGYIKGILPAGEWEVTGSLLVEDPDSLILEPGTTLLFHSGTELMINGYLSANGTESDSIRFTSYPGENWDGIYFQSGTPNPIINYCLIENSVSRGIIYNVTSGTISNSLIRNNYSIYDVGGGIYAYHSTLNINNTLFENNEYEKGSSNFAYPGGGAIFSYDGYSLNLNNCIFRNNISSHYGGAVGVRGTELYVESCLFEENTALYGGALSVVSGTVLTDVKLTDSHIVDNSASSGGGGIYIFGCRGEISNSVISGNNWTGIYAYSCGSIKMANLNIYNNGSDGIYIKPYDTVSYPPYISNCIISDNTGNGIECDTSVPEIIYNDVWNNTSGNFRNCGDYVGVAVTTNVNGDPCDSYNNISMDPLYLDAWNGDFILTENSPCIDAGTNTIDGYTFPVADCAGNYRIWDGDGNGSEIVDMGAYEYGASVGIEEQSIEIQDFTLYQNYPNPFNPVTTISYALANSAHVELSVYNLNGQLVKSLFEGKQVKGMHKAEFNGADLTSGVYIFSLKADGKTVQSKKMIMLK